MSMFVVKYTAIQIIDQVYGYINCCTNHSLIPVQPGVKSIAIQINRQGYRSINGQFHNCQSWSFIVVHGHS